LFGTNTPAYFVGTIVKEVKSFAALNSGANDIKLFTAVIYAVA
jgi:hypothetical protein